MLIICNGGKNAFGKFKLQVSPYVNEEEKTCNVKFEMKILWD